MSEDTNYATGPIDWELTAGMWKERAETLREQLAAAEAAKADVWDEALDHVWRLNDPAYTVITDTASIYPIATEADVYQAKRENPYRTGDTNA